MSKRRKGRGPEKDEPLNRPQDFHHPLCPENVLHIHKFANKLHQ